MKPFLAFLLCANALLAADAPRRAPGFSLPDVRFNQHDLAENRGKIVILDFVQTNCPACIKLTGVVEQLKAKYGGQVVTMSIVNPPDNLTTVGQFISIYKVTGPVLFDCGQATASYVLIRPDHPTVHFPHVFIIDQDGAIRYHASSDGNPAELEAPALGAAVEGLLQRGQSQKK
jgi:peroxiredoxin